MGHWDGHNWTLRFECSASPARLQVHPFLVFPFDSALMRLCAGAPMRCNPAPAPHLLQEATLAIYRAQWPRRWILHHVYDNIIQSFNS